MYRTPTIYTRRLCLRMFTEEDIIPANENWMSDPDVAEFTTWNAHRNIAETSFRIRGWIKDYSLGTMDWCIALRSDNTPIGSISAVQDFPDRGYCEIGYCLSKDYWNVGIMTEALRAVVQCIFSMTDYNWIQARFDSENEASGRCMEKAHFSDYLEFDDLCEKRGTTRHYILRHVERRDLISF